MLVKKAKAKAESAACAAAPEVRPTSLQRALEIKTAKAKAKEPKEKSKRTGQVSTFKELAVAGTRSRMEMPLGKGSGKNGKPGKLDFVHDDQPVDEEKDKDDIFV